MAVILEWLNYTRHSKIQLESQGEVEVIGASWEYSHVICGHTLQDLCPTAGQHRIQRLTYIVEDESRLGGKTELCSEFERNELYSRRNTANEVASSRGAGFGCQSASLTGVPMRLRSASRGCWWAVNI